MSNFTLSDYKLQAFLLANADKLIERSGRHSFSLHQYVKRLENSPSSFYRNKEQITPNTLNPSKTVDFVSDLPDDILQQLKLDVKVYKVFIVDSGDGPREREILLDAFVSHEEDENGNIIYNRLESADLSSEENRKKNPGDPGVQIESVEIVRLGGNPAEVDTNITVKISLFATSLQQYFTRYVGVGSGPITSDASLPDNIRQQAARGISWIDLIKIDLEEPGRDKFANFAKKYGIDVEQGFENNIFGSSLGYNNEEQRIKLSVGYREGRRTLEQLVETGELSYTMDEIAEFKAQIQAQTEVYYLNLHQNAFTFNARDGSVNLQIDYVASTGTSTIDRKNDLLFDPFFYEKELQANDAICRIEKNIDNEEPVIVTVDPFGPSVLKDGDRDGDVVESGPLSTDGQGNFLSDGTQLTVTTEEEKGQALNDLDDLKKTLQVLQANKLINGLYGYTLYNKNAFLNMVNSKPIRQFSRANILFTKATNVTGKISGTTAGIKHYNLGIYYKEESNNSTRKDIYTAQRSGQSQESFEEEMEDQIENDFGDQVADDEVNIEYVFFGDIIETAFEVLAANNRLTEGIDFVESFKSESSFVNEVRRHINDLDDYATRKVKEKNYTSKNVQFFVTPFYTNGGINDPRIAELYKEYGEILLSNLSYKSPADVNKTITISLANVPVSMIEFKKWFLKNISTKRKRHLFMKNYLESLIRWVSKLVGDAVAIDQSTTTDLEPPELLINRYFLNVDKYNFLPMIDNKTSSGNQSPLENRVNITNLSNYVDEQSVSKSLDAKVLTILGQTPSVKFSASRAGNKDLDRADKIPHILFADPGIGLLNDISFQREDMPGLREARLFEGKDMYGLEILREKYNATLVLYGNNFFKPGTIFYVDPGRLNVADFGFTRDGRSPARLLGLGGYYLVIRVTQELNVADNTWVTLVDAQWQTFGSDDGLYTREEEDDCITSITSRFARAVDINDARDRRDIAQGAIERAVESGLVGEAQEAQDLIQSDGTVRRLLESQGSGNPAFEEFEELVEDLGIDD